MNNDRLPRALRLALTLPVLLLVLASAHAQTITPMEQACFNSVQGKIAFDTAGHKQWPEAAVRALCRGALAAAPRGECFQQRMPSIGLKAAIQQCSQMGQPASGAPVSAPAPPAGANPPAAPVKVNAPPAQGVGQALGGLWDAYAPDGKRQKWIWQVTQAGSNLTFKGTAGSPPNFTATQSGNTLHDSLNRTGTISADGNQINWSNGALLRRDQTVQAGGPASGPPAQTAPPANTMPPAQIAAGCNAALQSQCENLVQDQIPWTLSGNMQDPAKKHWQQANLDQLCGCTANPAQTVNCFQNALWNGGQPSNFPNAILACQAKQPAGSPAPPTQGKTPPPPPTGLTVNPPAQGGSGQTALNGLWDAYGPDGKRLKLIWQVTQTGSNLTFKDSAGTNASFTATQSGNTLHDSLKRTGTISTDGNHISWSTGAMLMRHVSGTTSAPPTQTAPPEQGKTPPAPPTGLTVNPPTQGGSGQPALSGLWDAFAPNGQKQKWIWQVTVMGSNLTFKDTAGSPSSFTATQSGNTLHDSLNRTGTISPDGNQISWSNGAVLKREGSAQALAPPVSFGPPVSTKPPASSGPPANTPPAQQGPGLGAFAGTWDVYGPKGNKTANAWLITQSGSGLVFQSSANPQSGITATVSGNAISTSDKRTGTLSADSNQITWSGGNVWMREPAPVAPGTNPIKHVAMKNFAFGDWGYSQNEQTCMNLLQRKVAYTAPTPAANGRSASPGMTAWPEEAMNALCNGATNPQANVNCWQNNIAANGWDTQKTIMQCATIQPYNNRRVDFTFYGPAIGPDGKQAPPLLTGDQSEPAQVTLYNAPLSDADMQAVMQWIAVRVAALTTPYCYKQSYGRGAGVPMVCDSSLEKSGALCYPPTQPGYYCAGTICGAVCPSGFNDAGGFCQKPGAKTKSPSDSCPAGYHSVGCCICSPDCPSGWGDTGTGCTKPTYTRGGGSPLDACAPGLEQSGQLCYPTCKGGYTGSVAMCNQNCPAAQPTACGAGCADNARDCGITTASMILSPILAAIQIATGMADSEVVGQIAEVEQAMQTAREGVQSTEPIDIEAFEATKAKLALPENQGIITRAFTSTKQTIDSVTLNAKFYGNQTVSGLKANFPKPPDIPATLPPATGPLDSGPSIFAIVKDPPMANYRRYKVLSGIDRLVYTYASTYAATFAAQTSPDIEQQIDTNLGPVGANYVKMAYAQHTLALTLQANGEGTANDLLTILSVWDPTGLTGIVSAFDHPLCYDGTPFPSVTPLYKF